MKNLSHEVVVFAHCQTFCCSVCEHESLADLLELPTSCLIIPHVTYAISSWSLKTFRLTYKTMVSLAAMHHFSFTSSVQWEKDRKHCKVHAKFDKIKYVYLVLVTVSETKVCMYQNMLLDHFVIRLRLGIVNYAVT